ncbi:MAG: AAA family ATPase, partial [bacterium]|nr:AAA family ATPase [bacterium]
VQEGEKIFSYEWRITYKSFPTNNKFYLETKKDIPGKVVNGVQQPSTQKLQYEIVYWNSIKDFDEETKATYLPLTREKMEEIITPIVEKYFDLNEIPVSVWMSDPNYLIQDSISLKDFAEHTYKYPPLRNIFSLAGLESNDDINRKIDEIAQSSNYRKKLQKQLSDKTTEYMNKKWPEHKISIDVDISDELNIHVKVQDKDNTDAYHNMEERSQGFKQFVSLLLSLSVDNNTGDLKNNLILIDEPEVHMHPSGVRYMMQELLEIGKNNYVFIATHSNFMLDRSTQERHFLTTKKSGKTKIKQILSTEDLNDDEVLQSAFGMNVVRDFVSNNKLLVEGASDKILLQKALNKIKPNNCIKITNGKGDNLCAVASLSGYYEIYPIVVVDDDEQGKKIKKEIIKIGSNYSNETVFTLRELCGELKDCGTIEDALSLEYVQNKVNEVLSKNKISALEIKNDSPFCKQIKLHLQKNISDENLSKKDKKDKVENLILEIKTKISDGFETKKIDEKAPLLYKIATKIIEKFN